MLKCCEITLGAGDFSLDASLYVARVFGQQGWENQADIPFSEVALVIEALGQSVHGLGGVNTSSRSPSNNPMKIHFFVSEDSNT